MPPLWVKVRPVKLQLQLRPSKTVLTTGHEVPTAMRTIFLILVTALFPIAIAAQTSERISLRPGQQKTTNLGRINVRFVRLVEDSRCPMNAKCIWAGNARVRVEVFKARMTRKTFELNSGRDPRVATYGGYEFRFEDLTPAPPEPGRMPTRPTLLISVTRK